MKEVDLMALEKNSLSILLGYVVIMLCQILAQKLFWSSTLLYIVLTIIGILGTGLLLFLNHKFKFQNQIEKDKSPATAKIILWGLAGTVLVIIGQWLTLHLSHLLFHTPLFSNNTDQFLTIFHQTPFYAIDIVLITPIIEELIFRKVFFGNLTAYFKPWIAAIISSTLFAFAHQDGHFLTYFVMGLIFEFIYFKTHDIKASMISHVGLNLIVLLCNGIV